MQRITVDKAINTLTVETVLALENMDFQDKARAISGVVSVHSDIDVLELENIKLGELLLSPEQDHRIIVTADRVFLSGLAHDDDPTDPTDGDSVGRIHKAGDEEYMEAFAYMPGASGPYPNVELSEVAEVAAELVIAEVRKNRALWMRLHRMIQAYGLNTSVADALAEGMKHAYDSYGLDWRVLACEFTGQRSIVSVDDSEYQRMRELESIVTEDLYRRAWEIGKERGVVGDPMAVLLDVYEHGGRHYSVHGHGMQCQWDTSRGGAAWVPDELLRELIMERVKESQGNGWESLSQANRAILLQEEARKMCHGSLDEYNDWCSGNAWGLIDAVFDRATGELLEEEACWGLIGDSYAKREAESNVLYAAKRHLEARNAH